MESIEVSRLKKWSVLPLNISGSRVSPLDWSEYTQWTGNLWVLKL
jgi:hypothetical protein